MKLFCSHCGQPSELEAGQPGTGFACPRCGGPNTVPSAAAEGGSLCLPEPEPVLWQQRRRRATVLVAVAIVTLLATLAWLLLHPSAAGSTARQVKSAVFGPRVTEALERGRGGDGSSSGQDAPGQETEGQASPGQLAQGQGVPGQGAAGTAGNQTGPPEAAGQSLNPRRGNAPLDTPANPQLPANNGPELLAPEARSIGWLDRFFGQQRAAAATVRPGEGGTSEQLPGAGNPNVAPATSTNETVAAERTQAEVATAPLPLDELPAPTSTRSTNPPGPARRSELRDNMEELLQQHHAGSGDVRISLMWSNRNDIDLHVVDPNGEEIFYGHRAARSGGLLDIDMNAAPPFRVPAVENVYWPERAAPPGTYRIYVNHFRRNGSENVTPFRVRLLIRGRTTDFTGTLRFGELKKLVQQFQLAPR
jgi:hypothetical protein